MRMKLLFAGLAAAVLITVAGILSAPPFQGEIPVCAEIAQKAGQPLSLDTVVPGQLLCLPQIGPKRTEQIMELLNRERSAVLQDLEKIDGISQRMTDLWEVYFCTQ